MMRDQLLGYYEKELTFLRRMGSEFAEKYPKIAGRLSLESGRCADPHVERLIEAFAFLAARVRLKVDDEFPEVTESLLNVLYPHYLAPIPSMAIAQFALDTGQGKLTAGYDIPRGSMLYSRPIDGTPCRFQTAYPATLWPIEVVSAAIDPVSERSKSAPAALRIRLRCLNETRLSDLRMGGAERGSHIDRLRFYIHGDPRLAIGLYDLIFNQAMQVELRAQAEGVVSDQSTSPPPPVVLPPDRIKPVGFDPEEGLLPYPTRSFAGYRLLTEYFAFPDKFLFFEVTGLDVAARAGFGSQFEILIYLRKEPLGRWIVDTNTFQLGCTPIVNLFHKIAEPIQLTHRQYEYRVIPDINRPMATEVYAIDSISTADPAGRATLRFQPFYSFRHVYDGRDQDRAFWYATRRSSTRPDDPGTEVYLSLVDRNFNPHAPAVDTAAVHVTCTNRDLPGRLPFGGQAGDFQVEGAAMISHVRCLTKPTGTIRPPLRRGAHWRLLSHLALNYLSLVEGEAGGATDALQEMLLLYDFKDSTVTRNQIAGITRVDSRRVVRPLSAQTGAGLVRGVETTIEFDEEKYVGSGVFLFASVLERFLGLYASINSFSQLTAKIKQREGYLKRWAPRAGQQILL